jgi:hypothetical protein
VFYLGHGFGTVDEIILLIELVNRHEGELVLDSYRYVTQHFSVASYQIRNKFASIFSFNREVYIMS